MRLSALFLVLVLALVGAGCVSSEKNSENMNTYQNLVEVIPPDSNAVESKVYVDSVRHVSHQGSPALLIQGSFPDGCTKLKSATHTYDGDSLQVMLEAWKNPDSMCSQALVSFSFLYDNVDEVNLPALDSVAVNGKNYPL